MEVKQAPVDQGGVARDNLVAKLEGPVKRPTLIDPGERRIAAVFMQNEQDGEARSRPVILYGDHSHRSAELLRDFGRRRRTPALLARQESNFLFAVMYPDQGDSIPPKVFHQPE
jgi:hypothetical protein